MKTRPLPPTVRFNAVASTGRLFHGDRFEEAIDYRAVKKRILSLVEESNFFLLEALAEAVADACLGTPGVLKVQVRVDKPSALRFAKTVGVEIVRERGK